MSSPSVDGRELLFAKSKFGLLSKSLYNMETSSDEDIVVVEAVPFVGWKTNVRETVTPYLPPPVVKGWRQVDPLLKLYIGEEPIVTLAGSFLLAILVWQIVKAFSSLTSGRAIVDDDDDQVIASSSHKKEDYGETILLCGPPGAGKTRLLYQLLKTPNVSTVTSLRANVEISQKIRFMDYPGHASLRSAQFLQFLKESNGVVLVLDTTQPVASVADVLYQLLEHAHNNKSMKLQVFVACHKSDKPNAKNWRRIKIQLRTELERLLKVRSAEMDSSVENLWWTPGKPLDLDAIPHVTLQFCSTSCENQVGIEELQDFLNFCNGKTKPKTVAHVERV